MANKVDIARQSVIDDIIKLFTDKGTFVTYQDKKIYVNATGDGETSQFAISLTKPKVPIATINENENFPEVKTVQLSEEDRSKIAKLQDMLGLD